LLAQRDIRSPAMRVPTVPAVVLLVLATGACNRDYPNPFSQSTSSQPPPASAAIIFTSGQWSETAGAGREIYSMNLDGSALTRLTTCNNGDQPCDTAEVTSAPDRIRVYARRSLGDPLSLPALVYLDLARSVGQEVIPTTVATSSIDWSPADGVIVYTGRGEAGADDIYAMDVNGMNNRNLTQSGTVRERAIRIDPTGSVAAYERLEGLSTGKSRIFIFQNTATQIPVTSGGDGTDILPVTNYVVGSDTDPDYSPDGRSLVFRRLTSVGNGGLGTWDICTVTITGTNLTVIATGNLFRGAPDWGSRGIVFTETDVAAGTSRVVVMQPDGSGRQVPFTQAARFNIGTARWLP
jgi:Tol biopolymer transport system component